MNINLVAELLTQLSDTFLNVRKPTMLVECAEQRIHHSVVIVYRDISGTQVSFNFKQGGIYLVRRENP